jgi:hypothetical protein
MVFVQRYPDRVLAQHWQHRLAGLAVASCCWHAPSFPAVTAWLILAPDPAASAIGSLLFLLQSSPVPVAVHTRHPQVLAAAAPRLPRLAMLLSDTLDDQTFTQALRLLPAVHAGCMTLGYAS